MSAGRDLRRKAMNVAMSAACLACVALALLPLGSILYTSVDRGSRVLSVTFFTENQPYPCNPGVTQGCQYGGIYNAIQGSLVLIGLAAAIALPIGILTGIYLSEFARTRVGSTIRFVADVMTGLPSIVVGIFVYSLFILAANLGWISFNLVLSALSGAIALSVIMIPIVARTSEEALRLVPTATREAALALGIPRYRVVLRIVLTTGRAAVLTGALLATARAMGETAPLIVTDFGSSFAFSGIDHPSASLPLSIYSWTISPYANWQADAWGATLVLVAIMLGISVVARLALRQRFGRTIA